MPLNLIKEFSDLLEIDHLLEQDRKLSLQNIFNRDLDNDGSLKFKGKNIRTTKSKDGSSALNTLFHHLTTVEYEENPDEKGIKKRIFDRERAIRLHWIKFFIECRNTHSVSVFSVMERDQKRRKDAFRTYIYDSQNKYVIVLEPQRSKLDYYLLSAYHLNKDYGPKMMKKKLKKRLPDVL